MNKNIFNNAIRDVKRSTFNYRSALKLDKKNVGNEFTEEIDFEKESMKLGEDLNIQEENLNEKIKVTKLRSSMIRNTQTPYPTSFEKKENYNNLTKINNENCAFNNQLLNFTGNKNDITFPRRNNNLIIRNSQNKEIFIKQENDKSKNVKFSSENINNINEWKHDKFSEDIIYKYSVFIRNLPMNITENKLRDLFSLCGPILSLYIERDTAEIFYPRRENALDSVNKFNHSELYGKKIKVTFYENTDEKTHAKDCNNEIKYDDNKKVINLESLRDKKIPIFDKIIIRNNNSFGDMMDI